MTFGKCAFTLIELLAEIAIIAILAAILFPVFAQAKAAAKQTSRISDVKQMDLGKATRIFRDPGGPNANGNPGVANNGINFALTGWPTTWSTMHPYPLSTAGLDDIVGKVLISESGNYLVDKNTFHGPRWGAFNYVPGVCTNGYGKATDASPEIDCISGDLMMGRHVGGVTAVGPMEYLGTGIQAIGGMVSDRRRRLSQEFLLLWLLATVIVGCSSEGDGVIKPEPSKNPMEQRAAKGGQQTGK